MSLFDPNVPTGLVALNSDYKNIQNNFSQCNTSFGINHVPFSVTPSNGKHTFVEMINQSMIPSGLASGEATIYSRMPGSNSNLYFTPDASGKEYQLSRVSNNASALFGVLTQNYPAGDGSGSVGNNFYGAWTFLPGGLFLNYGTYNPGTISPSTGTVKFPVIYTNASSVIVTITPISSSGGTSNAYVVSLQNTQVTTGQFKWNFSTSTSSYVGFTWQAIGA
jgi:hypothetical protein